MESVISLAAIVCKQRLAMAIIDNVIYFSNIKYQIRRAET